MTGLGLTVIVKNIASPGHVPLLTKVGITLRFAIIGTVRPEAVKFKEVGSVCSDNVPAFEPRPTYGEPIPLVISHS